MRAGGEKGKNFPQVKRMLCMVTVAVYTYLYVHCVVCELVVYVIVRIGMHLCVCVCTCMIVYVSFLSALSKTLKQNRFFRGPHKYVYVCAVQTCYRLITITTFHLYTNFFPMN